MSTNDEDFYLIINRKADRYTVEAQGPGQISTEPIEFFYRETEAPYEALESIQEGYSPSAEEMAVVGAWLFGLLMPPPILMAFGSVRRGLPEHTRLRLRLNIRPPELARLPWELLFNPYDESFIATRRTQPVVRFLDNSTDPVASLQIEGPLKVLLVQSSPRDLSRLNLTASEQAMRETLGRRAQITLLPDATPAKLREMLRGETFHILHYDGHGQFEQNEEDEEGGVLHLQNDEGYTQTDHPRKRQEQRAMLVWCSWWTNLRNCGRKCPPTPRHVSSSLSKSNCPLCAYFWLLSMPAKALS